MKSEIFMPDEVVVRQYDKGSKLYFISRGKLEVYIKPDSQSCEEEVVQQDKNLLKFSIN